MPTARYGDDSRQPAIRSDAGAVQASKPAPAKLPGDAGTAAARVGPLPFAPCGVVAPAGVTAYAASSPVTRPTRQDRAPARAPHRRATFMATSAQRPAQSADDEPRAP